ncbi:3-hydroxyacyl-ACP dehydratase FabZ [Virgibacillus sp. Bac332]|uniref:3-hydroxyacyl-ACP dehydratase FabZ n=1 Tax=Virgibacillus sp. Bac332 TaxID=2419842 RepID=UPI000EF441EC|nr:3-hydroxyacyl-ACP dehydratase FabZ [Virgibacillus sp. Bac332]
MINGDKIKELIKHRYPFLLVDRVTELEEGKRAKGIKNVSLNEEFFNGHFPNHSVMPGTLIIEAFAQVSAIALSKEENKNQIGFLAGIDNCKITEQVLPGDCLEIDVEILRLKGTVGRGRGVATVNEKAVCKADLLFAIKNIN